MLMSTKRKIWSAFCTALLALAVACFGGIPAAADNPEPTTSAADSEPKAFEENLKRLAATDAEASANLEKFHALTSEQQGQIEQAVSDGTAGKELQEALSDSNPERAGALSRITIDNDVENESADGKEDATTSYRSSYSVKQEIFGITITKLSQSFAYDVQGGSVVATKSCTASSVNFNIVVALSDDTSHWVQGSHGICETTWHGNIFFKGFGVRLDKIQHLEVDARGIYNTWLVNA